MVSFIFLEQTAGIQYNIGYDEIHHQMMFKEAL